MHEAFPILKMRKDSKERKMFPILKMREDSKEPKMLSIKRRVQKIKNFY